MSSYNPNIYRPLRFNQGTRLTGCGCLDVLIGLALLASALLVVALVLGRL